MDVYEITGYATGTSQAGVNYLQPADSFQNIYNGFIYRQVLQSRQGVGYFTPQLAGGTRVMGIFEHTLPNSTKQLLAFDTNFLYLYNTSTGIFDQIPFGGSLSSYTGFNIPGKDQYISGTSYPTASNAARFIFTSPGITQSSNDSSVFFFDGTYVKDFTNIVDNPNYSAAPQGALNNAIYILWFNGRLNFIYPTLGGVPYSNGILYSGIRDTSGNGDKFNVPGSGLFRPSTYQNITGASILGQIMLLNFDRMAYVLERTTDPFNPYFGREIASVLGTNAPFSAVSWNDKVSSIGRTGILDTDGRQNLRVDNKLPYFTQNNIEPTLFELTYGGFDRSNAQYLWAYKNSDISGLTQDSVLARNYEEGSFSIYDQRFSVFGQTDVGMDLTWNDISETSGNTSWAQWNTTEEIWNKIGIGASVQKTLAGDDLGFIYELNSDYDDYFTTISNVTPGTTTTITVAAVGILPGDFVTVSNVGGMVQLNNFNPATNTQTGELYTVLSATETSITINVDSTQFSAYTSGGNISKVISFYAETIPFNPYRSIGRRCYVSHIEFLINTNGGNITVDMYADQDESPFKFNVLCQPNSNNKAAEWVTATVDQESDFLTFVMKQTSPAVQLQLTSVRLHCNPGGMTSGG